MPQDNFYKWKAWTQSPRVKVVVGVQQETFLMPRELLRQRSEYFRARLGLDESFFLLETEPSTFDDFYRWSLCENPCIWEEIHQDRLEKLGIFAEKYHIPALVHQVVDAFHKKLKSHDWELQPDMVRRIYQKLGPECCLRMMVKAALDLAAPEKFVEKQSDWDALVYEGGDAAVDIFQAVSTSLNTQRLRLHRSFEEDGPCRFHKHLNETLGCYRQSSWFFPSQECPFQATECFPNDTLLSSSSPGQDNGPTKLSKKERSLRNEMKRKNEWEKMAYTKATLPTVEDEPAEEAPAEEAPAEEAPPAEVYTLPDETLPAVEDTPAEVYKLPDETLPAVEDKPAEEETTAEVYTLREETVPAEEDTPAEVCTLREETLPAVEDTPAEVYTLPEETLPAVEDKPVEEDTSALEDTPAEVYTLREETLPAVEDTPSEEAPPAEDTPPETLPAVEDALVVDDIPALEYQESLRSEVLDWTVVD